MKAELHISTEEIVKEIIQSILQSLKPHLKKDKGEDTLFTVKSLAEYLEVSDQWIYERVQLNEIPFTKVGKHLRFRKSDIDKWLDSLTTPAMNPLSKTLRSIK